MGDSLLNDNYRKADLSFSYLAALSAITGYTCQRGPEPDLDSVDAIVKAGGSMRPQLDVQLKATSVPRLYDDGLHFRLCLKNYNDLVTPRMCPIILVVLELPEDSDDWLLCGAGGLTIRRRAWWLSISGWPDIDTSTKTVVLPRSQLLTPDSLRMLMDQARTGKLSGGVTP